MCLPPEPGIAHQGAHGAGVQRHQAVLAVLGVAHYQQFPAGVEVLVIEADRFPDPDPADREQADQSLVGGRPQPGLQRGRRLDERADLGIGIQVWRGPAHPRAELACRDDLGRGIDAVQVGGEPAHHGQADRLPVR